MHLRKALILFSLVPYFLQAQPVLKKPNPQWIEKIVPSLTIKNDTSNAGGYYFLLMDRQFNYNLQESFRHFAYKILSNEGVQQMSDLSVDFDPAYEKLSFHSLKIYRKDEIIDVLKSVEIKTIQREQSMERFLYDGTKTAIVNIKDVRIGDIIEYAYSIKGFNPVYKGHFSQYLYLESGYPFQKTFHRMVLPKSRDFQIHYRNGESKPIIKESGQLIDYSWTAENVAALTVDNNVPSWYDPYKYVVVTDFKNWKEKNDWALQQFVLTPKQIDQLRKKLPKNLLEGTTEEKILKAIRFVQDEVRYLGFENGIHSHQPHPPDQVLEQRFGDCKDKSLLLVSIVKLFGVEAYPVLVNTTLRNNITDDPPTTQAFDHCVVQLSLNNQPIFIDPTINNQGGSLNAIFFPTYSKGLVVSSETTDITKLSSPISSETIEEQFFTLESPGNGTTFKVRTTYTGKDADNQRSEFANANLAETQKSYLTFYGNLYPDITANQNLKITDDREKNVLIVDEDYSIKNFWKENEDVTNQIYCEFYPQSIDRLLNINKLTQRKAPYKLTYPLSYKQTIKIKLPESWTVTTDNKSIQSEYYSFDYYVSYINDEISLSYNYQTKKPEVPAENITQFVKDHQEMMENLSFNLTYNKAASQNASDNQSLAGSIPLFLVVISAIIGCVLVIRLHKYDPPAEAVNDDPDTIGGWLILVAIGLRVTPLVLIFQLMNKENNFFNTELWAGLWETQQLELLTFVSFELVYNIIFLFFSGLIVILFFQRRSSLPFMIQFFYGISFAVILLDSVASSYLTDTALKDSFKDIFRSFIAACVWIPYFRVSDRVKRTFVFRHN